MKRLNFQKITKALKEMQVSKATSIKGSCLLLWIVHYSL